MQDLILGIDQSLTCTGLVVLDTDGTLIHHTTVKTKPNKSNPYDLYERIQTICDAIREICRQNTIKTVVIEGLSFASVGKSTRDLAGLHAVIVVMLQNMKTDDTSNITNVFIVPPTALKKYATGKGTASKECMLEALPDPLKSIFETYPMTGGRYDLTDAYHLAKCAIDNVACLKTIPPKKTKLIQLKIKD